MGQASADNLSEVRADLVSSQRRLESAGKGSSGIADGGAGIKTQMQTRQARVELTAYTLELKKATIPANAVLHDFRVGLGHEGLAPHNPDVASFRYEGQVYSTLSMR
jgi:hypothetical protein